jgi:uncharacterized membrane protein YhhN
VNANLGFPIAVLVVGLTLLLRAEHLSPRDVRQVMIWKPLATASVIAVCALSLTQPRFDAAYTGWMLAGLALSLVGDVLLIPSDNSKAFLAGLIAFLLAHIVYIAAFTRLQSTLNRPAQTLAEIVGAIVLALIGGAFYRVMRPGLGKLRLPVIGYMIVISVTVHRALAIALVHPGPLAQPMLILFGALLFYVSDAILGVNKFRFDGRMPYYKLFNLSSYYAGQLLLALSASTFV